MKINKKGAEMSLNVIIIAAITLIVLIILVFIFTGRMNIFGKGLEDCYSKGEGADCGVDCGEGYVKIPGTDCDDKAIPQRGCCIKVFRK